MHVVHDSWHHVYVNCPSSPCGRINIHLKIHGLWCRNLLHTACLMFFLHLHVHRWPSIGEKICLWICLTLMECNCFLIWARGQTSVHSAAVKGPLHSILFIQLSLFYTTNLYSGGEMLPIIGHPANRTIMCHCSTSSAYIAIFTHSYLVPIN